MSSDFTLRTVVDYLALPALEIPVVSHRHTGGRIYHVLSVDFYIALRSDCELHDLPAMEIPNLDRCALPTIVVDMDESPVFVRLPHSLAEWAFDVVQRHSQGGGMFPASVEFGISRDQHAARFL